MKFWETSALVPLCVAEPASASARALFESDPSAVVWWGTAVEGASALARRRREGRLSPEMHAHAEASMDVIRRTAFTIDPSPRLLDRAVRLVKVHPLRAADAFQLAAALAWAGDAPAGYELVSLDRRLRDAALREGFSVLPDEIPEP